MRSTALFFLILAVCCCGNEPERFDQHDHNYPDSGDSDSDTDLPDTETQTNTDIDTDTSSTNDVDSGPDGDADSDSDVDTETETSSDTTTDTDTGSETGTATEDDTESDSDTATDGDAGITCPWQCHELDGDGYQTCDDDTDAPSIVHNQNFSCLDGHDLCCQPLDSDLPGAIHEYCNDNGYECHTANQCAGKIVHAEYYCKNATIVCCDTGGVKEGNH